MPNKKSSKPKPSDLGTGMAARAGRKLKGRAAQLAAIEARATGTKKNKATKKKKK